MALWGSFCVLKIYNSRLQDLYFHGMILTQGHVISKLLRAPSKNFWGARNK